MSRCFSSLAARVLGSGILLRVLCSAFPGLAQQGLSLNVDLASYRYNDAASYLEIYYSFPLAEMAAVGDSQTGYTSQVLLTLQIYQRDSLWAAKQWKLERMMQAPVGPDSKLQIVDVQRYICDEPGPYRVVLYARDLNRPERLDSVATSITLRKISSTELALSDLQLATEIRRSVSDSTNAFVKNRYEIIPNPGRLFGEGSPLLCYYFEVYNLLKHVTGDRYKTRCVIKNSNGVIEPGVVTPDHTKMKMANASMEMGMINLSSLASGTYSLVYGIVDLSGKMLTSGEKKFYIYNPRVAGVASVANTAALTFSALDLLADEQLDEEFAQMEYVSSHDEKKFYKNLQSLGGKRQFIQALWQSPKPTFTTTGQALRQEYLQRVDNANSLYSTNFRPGWKTDRGRVYILYGPASTVERFPSTAETKPYEIWSYDEMQGGVVFIFVDRYGFRNYELIHSTLRGELQNPNWQSLIQTSLSGGINQND